MRLYFLSFLIFIALNDSIAFNCQDLESRSMMVKPSLSKTLTNFGYTKIPLFNLNGSALYFKGSIQNQAVYFLLDTGSTKASIFCEPADKLKLDPILSDEKIMNMNGEIKYAKKVILSDVSIENINVDEISANLMEQPFKNDLATIVLGNEFLEKYNAIIDLGKKFLYLNPVKVSSKIQNNLKQLLTGYFQLVPLTRLISGQYILPVQVNDSLPVNFLIDTGTSETTLSDLYVNYLKIKSSDELQTIEATNGRFKFSNVTIDKVVFNPLQVFYSKPIELKSIQAVSAAISNMASVLGIVAILGLPEMINLKIIINFPAQSIFLAEPTA